MNLPNNLSTCLSAHLPTYLHTHLPTHLSLLTYLPTFPATYLSTYPPTTLPTYQSTYFPSNNTFSSLSLWLGAPELVEVWPCELVLTPVAAPVSKIVLSFLPLTCDQFTGRRMVLILNSPGELRPQTHPSKPLYHYCQHHIEEQH